MKKSEWIFLSNAMWNFADKTNGRISPLLKELIQKLNKNQGVILDELDDNVQTVRSNRQQKPNATSKDDFKGNGEF